MLIQRGLLRTTLAALGILLLSSAVPSASVFAQEFDSPEALQTLDITGLSAEEIRSLLGEPDKRGANGQTERWEYGPAQIFLAADHVVAWTNAAAISERRERMEVQKAVEKQPTADTDTYIGWKPISEATPRAVIDDLLGLRLSEDLLAQEVRQPVTPVEFEKKSVDSLFR